MSTPDPADVQDVLRAKMLRWVFFTVGASFIPFFLAMAAMNFEGFRRLVAHGELIFVAVAFAADAVGDVILADGVKKTVLVAFEAGCGMLILASSVGYMRIAQTQGLIGSSFFGLESDTGVVLFSLICFGVSLALSFYAKRMVARLEGARHGS